MKNKDICKAEAQKGTRKYSLVVDQIVNSYNLVSQGLNPPFLSKINLTTSQMKALLLFEDNKKFSMGELSERYAVSVSTMTSMVGRLFQNGMLKREQDKNDRRVVMVSLTAKGKKVVSRLVNARREVLEKFLYTLDADETKRFERAMNDAAYFLGRAREKIRTGH